MKRFSVWILLFAVLSLVFFILLVFLRTPFPLYPLMSYQDAFDLLTPLVLIPLYFTLFAITNEGQTVWMGLPFSILGTLFGLGRGRKRLGQQPVPAFFLVSCVVAPLLYIGWGLAWGGFPEFGEVGLL